MGVGFGKIDEPPNPKLPALETNIHEIIFSNCKFDFFARICYNICIGEPKCVLSHISPTIFLYLWRNAQWRIAYT